MLMNPHMPRLIPIRACSSLMPSLMRAALPSSVLWGRHLSAIPRWPRWAILGGLGGVKDGLELPNPLAM